MSRSKTTGKESAQTPALRGAKEPRAADPESVARFQETMRLRSLAAATRAEYLRMVRQLVVRHGGDPAGLDEAAVRAHLLWLKDDVRYSPSSMRMAVAAMRAYYGRHLGRDWRLFDLVRSPSAQKLPAVLTRAEVARLFATVRRPRFRTFFRLIYACGLRISEALQLEVRDLREPGRVHIRAGKGDKERYVPLPELMREELRAWWKTHRHPRWLFPGAVRPMGMNAAQHCMRLARVEAGLPAGTVVHTLRHSYATHLLEEGVSIRLISAYLGHASLETTLIYTHLTAVNEAGARAAVARLLAVSAPPPSGPV